MSENDVKNVNNGALKVEVDAEDLTAIAFKKDLAWIKKHYGEQMMHMCRSMFPQILEVPGELPKILKKHFAESRQLADVIKNDQIEGQFKAIVFSYFADGKCPKIQTDKSAIELMDEAGYILYPECQTNEEIQAFRKYYAPGESLCTFDDLGRLDTCRVWFAVKKNVDEIKREDFKHPRRQDEYGTSVISIQFEKGLNPKLSIKNRYNHTVPNRDNTFNSDLENIIPGLTDAFERDYGAVESIKTDVKEIDDFLCIDGKYYHYNRKLNDKYYCDNNVIIDHGKVIELDPFTELLMDYFIVDFKNKTIKLFDKGLKDSFVDSFGKIKRITKQGDTVTVMVENGEDITIKLDSKNNIISLNNPNMESCGDFFLSNNESLTELNLPRLESCGVHFLDCNKELKELNLPNLKSCENVFLYQNDSLTELNLPNLVSCGAGFLSHNRSLTEFNVPNLVSCGNGFLHCNGLVKEVFLPKLETCGDDFLCENNSLTELSLPSLVSCACGFLSHNESLTKLNLPNLKSCGAFFLNFNNALTELSLPKLEECEFVFLYSNNSLRVLSLPNLVSCGGDFLSRNNSLTELNLPNLVNCGEKFLSKNNSLTELNLPRLKSCGDDFFEHNKSLKKLKLPKLKSCGFGFLRDNNALAKLSLPKLEKCGGEFLPNNNLITELNLPKLKSCVYGFLRSNDSLRELNLPSLEYHGKMFLSALYGRLGVDEDYLDSIFNIREALKDEYGNNDVNKPSQPGD